MSDIVILIQILLIDCIVYAKSRHKRAKLQLSPLVLVSFLALCSHSLFLSPLHSLSSLASPAPPLPLLDSPLRVEDLPADPDPTHKRRVDNQLPLSSGLNRPTSEFPRDALPSEAGLLPIIPHLLSHSSLIFGALIPAIFWFLHCCIPLQAAAGWQDDIRE